MYVCGKTGTGKSHLLRTLFLQDVWNEEGCVLLDPHGDLAREVAAKCKGRGHDVLYLDTGDPRSQWRLNPVGSVAIGNRALAVANLVEVFKKMWPDDWGPRLEHLLRNVLFLLLEIPDADLGLVPRLLTDTSYRRSALQTIENDVVRAFWVEEYSRYSQAFRSVVTAPLQNKIGAFLTDPMLRRILTEPGTRLDLAKAMEERRTIIVNLDKGRIGEGPSALLGSLILSEVALAALRRSGQDERARTNFWVYADEFQTFTTLSIATMLSELRKYHVGMTLSHQHLSQLDPAIRDAVFGNAGTVVAFRVGAADAQYLAKEFTPVFSVEDLISLEKYHICIRLQIDGAQSRPFSARTLSPEDEVSEEP